MRQALEEFRKAGVVDDGGVEVGDGTAEDETEPLEQRVVVLEEEGRELRELVDVQAGQLEELGRRVARLEEQAQQRVDAETVGVDGLQSVWRPPRRGHGLPSTGVVTLEKQPDEAHAFGPAEGLVAEWRSLRTRGDNAGSRVDRVKAGVRRWELEVTLLRDFRLTLPPETEPLDDDRRADHLRWRLDALEDAKRELRKAKRVRLLRRVLTLGLWWK